jgi:hypothetical protein
MTNTELKLIGQDVVVLESGKDARSFDVHPPRFWHWRGSKRKLWVAGVCILLGCLVATVLVVGLLKGISSRLSTSRIRTSITGAKTLPFYLIPKQLHVHPDRDHGYEGQTRDLLIAMQGRQYKLLHIILVARPALTMIIHSFY